LVEFGYYDEGGQRSDFISVTSSGLMPVTIGAKRRWRMDLDRSDRHPSTVR